MSSKEYSFGLVAVLLLVQLLAAAAAQECPWSCGTTASTYCENGECHCKNSTLVFDNLSFKCKLGVGQSCSTSSECISNVPCLNPDNSTSEEDKICFNGLGGHCNRNLACNTGSFLACLNGVCRCEDLVNHVEENGLCVLRAFSAGCLDDTTPACAQGSECSSDGICVCRPNTRLLDGACTSSICNSQYECSRFGLECRNGACSCATDSMMYDGLRKYCYLSLGQRCDLTSNSTSVPVSSSRPDYCLTPEAKCDWNSSGYFKECRCDEKNGYEQDEDSVSGEKVCIKNK